MVVPILQTNGVIEGAGFAAIVQWTLWFGASCMVAAGLLSFALSWRTALRAFGDLGQMLSVRSAAASERSRVEQLPMSWFAVGQIAVSLVALALARARELRYACLAKWYCGGAARSYWRWSPVA